MHDTELDDKRGPLEHATLEGRSPAAMAFAKRGILRALLRDRGLSPLDREIARQRRLYARQLARAGR